MSILIMFFLLMGLYFLGVPIGLVIYMHTIFCCYIVCYFISKKDMENKIRTKKIAQYLTITTVIVVCAGNLTEYIHFKINRPDNNIKLFLEKEKYKMDNSHYHTYIKDGLTYDEFKKFEYVSIERDSNYYVSYDYTVRYKDKENYYIVRWYKNGESILMDFLKE